MADVDLHVRMHTKQAQAEITRLGKRASGLGRDFKSAGRSGASGLAQLTRGVGSLVSAWALLNITRQTAELQKQGFQIANLRENFNRWTAELNQNGPKLLRAMKNVTRGLVSELDLIKESNLALAAGIFSPEELLKASEASVKIAQATGRDVQDTFSRVIRGIAKAEPELLDELGLLSLLNEALRDYANEHNVAQDSIDKVTRSIIFKNIILAEAEKKFGDVEIRVNAAAQSLINVEDGWNTLLEQFSKDEATADAVADIFNDLAGALKWIADNSSTISKGFSYLFTAIKTGLYTSGLMPFLHALTKLIEAIDKGPGGMARGQVISEAQKNLENIAASLTEIRGGGFATATSQKQQAMRDKYISQLSSVGKQRLVSKLKKPIGEASLQDLEAALLDEAFMITNYLTEQGAEVPDLGVSTISSEVKTAMRPGREKGGKGKKAKAFKDYRIKIGKLPVEYELEAEMLRIDLIDQMHELRVEQEEEVMKMQMDALEQEADRRNQLAQQYGSTLRNVTQDATERGLKSAFVSFFTSKAFDLFEFAITDLIKSALRPQGGTLGTVGTIATTLFGAEGGMVKGGVKGVDSVPAMVQHGEFIQNAPGTALMERDFPGLLEEYRQRGLRGFAMGGSVSPTSNMMANITLMIDGHVLYRKVVLAEERRAQKGMA